MTTTTPAKPKAPSSIRLKARRTLLAMLEKHELSPADMAALLDSTVGSVINWIDNKTTPDYAHSERIFALQRDLQSGARETPASGSESKSGSPAAAAAATLSSMLAAVPTSLLLAEVTRRMEGA